MKKDKILLVEDDSTLSFIIEDALMREGFEVECAFNGMRGREMFLKVMPDLGIADVMGRKKD
ncbi:MAG: DNA-binding response regulator, partial [Muribaculaceae bacterium]|nr:DNA-binding response regulator [Muribaculaceae bacterium]